MSKFEVVCIDDSLIKGVQKGDHYYMEKYEGMRSGTYHHNLYNKKGNKIRTFYGTRARKCFANKEEWREQQLNLILNE